MPYDNDFPLELPEEYQDRLAQEYIQSRQQGNRWNPRGVSAKQGWPQEDAAMAIAANQERMRQWAAPVKQQNKQMKNNYMNNGDIRDPQGAWRDVDFVGKSGTNRFGSMDAPTLPGGKLINRLAGPVGALPMVAPEALGIYGATQEAQRQGVNPMVNWLQRMTPAPVVAPTGRGGEVYNYQSGERYTPEY